MAKSANGTLHWFCGPESSDVEVLTDGDPHTSCLLNTVYCVPHAVLILSATVILIYMRYFQSEVSARYKPGAAADVLLRLRYPLHDIRWLLLLTLVLLTFFQFGEGLLTNTLVVKGGAHPQFFIPGVISFVAAIVSMIFYDHTELWDKPTMLWLQVVYWLTATTNEILRFSDLRRIPQMNLAILKYDITLLMLLIYVSFIFMDIYLLLNRVILSGYLARATYGDTDFAQDALNPNCKYRHNYSNYASSLSVWWLNYLFKAGKKRPLEVNDLGELPTRFKSQECVDDLNAEIQRELMNKDSVDINDISFVKIYCKQHGIHMIVAGFQKMVSNILQLSAPLLLQAIINQITSFYEDEVQVIQKDAGYIYIADAVKNVYVLVTILFVVMFLSALLNQRHTQIMFHISSRVRSALQGAVYLKAQQLSPSALNSSDMSTGRITNHIAADPINMQLFFVFIHLLWTAPVQLVIMLYLLHSIVGPSALIGAISFLVAMLVQGWVAKMIGKFQTKVMTCTDIRLKGTNETLQGIKLVKLNGWEQKFQERICDARDNEIDVLFKVARLSSSMTPLAIVTYSSAILLSFSVYYKIMGVPLTPDILFPALSLFQSMSGPLMTLPSSIMAAVNAYISLKRLRKFLGAPEVENYVKGRPGLGTVQAKDTCHSGQHRHDEWMRRRKQALTGDSYGTFGKTPIFAKEDHERLPSNQSMKIEKGTFTWEDPNLPSLTNINIEIRAGKLTAVVGEVGSGKSSLISALLGEMRLVSGQVLWNSDRNSVSYACQKAWLVNASLKDNILFGTPFDLNRYNKVIEVCGLRQDIDMLPAGDRTEIGEKGINLSGGQKQRVSIARAVYSYTDIVIMDDPLSALDAHVGSHVFKQALRKFLIEEGRTVLLVTHQTQFLPDVDKVIILKNGSVLLQGTPGEIRKSNPAMYDAWVTTASATRELVMADVSHKDHGIDKDIQALRNQIKEREKEIRFRLSSRLSRRSSFLEEEEPFDPEEMSMFAEEPSAEESDGSTLIKAEERNEGSVSWRVYFYYMQAVGLKSSLFLAVMYLATFVFNTVNNFWLSGWSEAGLSRNSTVAEIKSTNQYYVIGYLLLTVGTLIFTYLANAGTFISSLRAGRYIHKQVLQNITQSPMRFFDTTPIGRILNRFSVDTKLIDQTIGFSLTLVLQFTMGTAVGLMINVIAAPIFILGLVPLIILYCYITSYYISTTRELKRLESITLSPVYSQFTETISGLSTIRAYNKQACFAGAAMDKINISTITNVYRQGSNFWLQFRLNFVGTSVVLVGGVTVISTFFAGAIDPSVVAMAMSVSLFSAQQLMQLVTQSAELEMQMNAVERLQHFANLVTEKQDGVFDPPADWPFMGDITIVNMEMRYAKELEPVLQDINLRIKGGEKVGICGRTGSGKSSMMLAFFRLIEKTRGEIYIDGVNLDHVPLAVVRQRLSIVPQDPTLFTGTIRFNLDPFDKCNDDEIWEALGIAQMKSTVSNLPDGIESMVTEGGENFSVGQRQLFCLARAFLRKSRILIMDEATASIDKEMDAVLQDVLFTAFKDKTVLTIAHRVSTILSYDTIIVLSDGKVAEWDSPSSLLSKPDSIFSSLVNKDKEDEL